MDEGTVGDAHPEYFGECLDHRVGDVISETPESKAEGYEHERDHVADPVLAQNRCFVIIHWKLLVERSEIGAGSEIGTFLVHSEGIPAGWTENVPVGHVVHAHRDAKH